MLGEIAKFHRTARAVSNIELAGAFGTSDRLGEGAPFWRVTRAYFIDARRGGVRSRGGVTRWSAGGLRCPRRIATVTSQHLDVFREHRIEALPRGKFRLEILPLQSEQLRLERAIWGAVLRGPHAGTPTAKPIAC